MKKVSGRFLGVTLLGGIIRWAVDPLVTDGPSVTGWSLTESLGGILTGIGALFVLPRLSLLPAPAKPEGISLLYNRVLSFRLCA